MICRPARPGAPAEDGTVVTGRIGRVLTEIWRFGNAAPNFLMTGGA